MPVHMEGSVPCFTVAASKGEVLHGILCSVLNRVLNREGPSFPPSLNRLSFSPT